MLANRFHFMFFQRVKYQAAHPVLLLLSIMTLALSANAQQFEFATLDGSPTIDTTGWNLAGDATPDDTPGDANNDPDELLLCPAVNNTSGACFYDQTLDLSVCKKWTAEFDYRIYGGSGADGIAFCFLTNPPTGYALGGGIGIPSNPQGLMVILDQYDNGCGSNPQVQLFYGDGATDYKECRADKRVTNVGVVRSANYNRCKITYDNGQIDVFINGNLIISGNYTTNYTGYLGFTSSTGGSTDNHSIKNAVIYTSKPPSDAGPDQTICSGDTTQIGTSPTTNYTYSWSPSIGLSDSSAANPDVSLTNNTNSPIQQEYVVTTDSANIGCTSTDTMVVTVNPPASGDAGNDTMICPGGTATLTATGGTSYSWSHGPSVSTTQVSPASTTTYVVTVADQKGCIDTDSVTVSINPSFSTSITTSSYNGGYQVSCNSATDGSIDLTVNGGTPPYTYSWNGGQFQSKNLNNIAAGTYAVTVTDANGCTIQDDTTLIGPPPIDLDLSISSYDGGYNVSCPNASDGSIQLFVNGGLAPYSYNWNNNATTKNLSNISSGGYSVTVTDSNGCSSTIDTTLKEPSPLSTDLTPSTYSGGHNVSCADSKDGSIDTDITGGASPYNLSWNNGAYSSQNLTTLPSGTYNLSLTDANGCVHTDSITLNAPEPLDGNIEKQEVTCAGGSDGRASIEINGGTPPYKFSWDNGRTDSVLTTLTNGDYNATVNDANNCQYTQSITISEPAPLSISIPKYDTIRFGDTAQFQLEYFAGGKDVSFEWSQEQSLSCSNCKDPYAYPRQTKDYKVTMTDSEGCITSESIKLVVLQDKTIYIPNSFSPDQDGLNDRFRVFTKGLESGSMKIFNRWGEKIYQTSKVLRGWNGTIQDTKVESGVYVYVIELNYHDDTVEKRKGSVTVIR